ncbi:MAG TPA: hypothetical protein VK431_04745, partial [Nitrosopumilaceae archaeon]|nr:hypothetical protein [Nitrosopumilaceae archaeon]
MNSVLLPKVFGLSIIAIMVSGTAVSPVFASTATSGDLYFTTFAGGTNVNKVHYTYDGASTFTLGSITNIASTTTADGLNFLPNGKLFVGGQGDSAHVVDPNAV